MIACFLHVYILVCVLTLNITSSRYDLVFSLLIMVSISIDTYHDRNIYFLNSHSVYSNKHITITVTLNITNSPW